MAEATAISEQAKPQHPIVAFKQQLDVRASEFRNALPAHMPVERFTRVAMTAVQLNQELLACDRRSLFNSLMRCANDGLIPDGRQAAIVPFNDNNPRSPTKGQKVATYMPMVAGLLARFRNSGQFKSVTTNVVRENEAFRHWIDENGEHLTHEPGDGDGKVVKAYAMATTKDGGVMIKVMSTVEINKRRNVSRAKDGPMWSDWWDEAAMKTVLRNLHKVLPSSSDDLDRLMARDAEVYGFTAAEAPTARAERTLGVKGALDQFGGEVVDGELAVPPTQPEGPATDGQEPTAETATLAQGPTPIEEARQRGIEARRGNMQRRATPPEYRDAARKAEHDAWLEGWDAGAE